MPILTAANLLLIFASVSYFLHAYFHNTVDFLDYRHRMAIPVKNWPLKYMYVNSFILCILSAIVLVASVVVGALQLESLTAKRAVLAIAMILALGALRLVTKPNIVKWPKRAG